MQIFKILLPWEWQELQRDGQTSGAPIDVKDGYIHFSTGLQIRETAEKHFHGEKEIYVLACDTDQMYSPLKWEVSRGGDLFPHLYGPLDIRSVLWHEAVTFKYGQHQFSERIPLV
tara:strand:- start:203 stop:547 length:345 start_codon:yes stop_codon:yes gene_type:complete